MRYTLMSINLDPKVAKVGHIIEVITLKLTPEECGQLHERIDKFNEFSLSQKSENVRFLLCGVHKPIDMQAACDILAEYYCVLTDPERTTA